MRNRTYSHSTGFDNPMGVLVKRATDSALSSPDWVVNMMICDMCRGSSYK